MGGIQSTALCIGGYIGVVKKMTKGMKTKSCDICGGLMEKGGAGYICSSCHNIEWHTKESTSISSVTKCPNCGGASVNPLMCNICGEPISEKMRKLKEMKNK